jgi:hypothetical protein
MWGPAEHETRMLTIQERRYARTLEYEIPRLEILPVSVNITYNKSSFPRPEGTDRLEVFESRVLRRIFGLQRGEMIGV